MKDIFCAKCQAITPHKGEVDQNGEFIFYCQNVVDDVACDRFLKFPSDVTVESFNSLIEQHHEANVGQVSLEKQEEKLTTLLDQLASSPNGQVQPEA